MIRRAAVALVCTAALAAGCSADPGGGAITPTSGTASSTPAAPPSARPDAARRLPLAGRVVVLDPGHQLGNRHHAAQIRRPIDAGGFAKPCNTTGTATASGVPESTVVWRLTRSVARRLRALGATVVLTRTSDSDRRWGPCVDVRGTIGNPGTPGPDADLRVSIHGDGTLRRGAHGFHVISPGLLRGWTETTRGPSARAARDVRDALVAGGLTPSTYVGRRGLVQRTDLATLNRSRVPALLVEAGNLRDPRDARLLVGAGGRERVARALVNGIVAALA